MRKLLLLLMMATTAATPALAQDRDRGERRAGFGERLRAAVEERRSESADRPARAERQQQQPQRQQVRQERREQRQQQRARVIEQRGDQGVQVQRRTERLRQVEQQPSRTIAGTERPRGFGDRLQDAVAIERARQSGDFRDGRRDRDGNRDWRDGNRRYDHNWRNEWRRDSRYDWRRYRDRNRSLFRFGIYYDPFGYSYRPYSIGWPMLSSYWRSNYWIQDPWMYRLPPAYGPYRWIRYWDDAVLVDTRSGRVVDVIHNFFW